MWRPHLALHFADPSVLIIASYLLSTNWINTQLLSNRCEWLRIVFIPITKKKRKKKKPNASWKSEICCKVARDFAVSTQPPVRRRSAPSPPPSFPWHTVFESLVYTLPTMTLLTPNFVNEQRVSVRPSPSVEVSNPWQQDAVTTVVVEIETGIEVGLLMRNLRLSRRFYRGLMLLGCDAVSLDVCRRFGGTSPLCSKI